MTATLARALRLDGSTWRRISAMATPAGAALVVFGAYVVLAFDRFGLQGFFEFRATTRLVLTGLYGWMWLVAGTWLIARFAFGWLGSARLIVPLFGHAHLPLLLVAVLIQFSSVALSLTAPALWLAVFAGAFWLPAMLVVATRNVANLTLGQSMLAAGVPYGAWAAVVGRTLWRQLGHLL